VCVIYSDIVAWSDQSVTDQIASAQSLFTRLVVLQRQYGLTEVWKTSTGDGFAVAFDRDVAFRVCRLAHELVSLYRSVGGPKLRVALSAGLIDSFDNALTGNLDFTGPAIVKARRILDGITGGSILLVQKDLADEVERQQASMDMKFVPHPAIKDKHGHEHEVRQVSEVRTKYPSPRKIPRSLADLARVSTSREILKTGDELCESLPSLDGLIMLWMDDQPTGIPAASVVVDPMLPVVHLRGSLQAVSSRLETFAAPYRDRVKESVLPRNNNPKLWLRGFQSPSTERPFLRLEVGITDYRTARAHEAAFDDGPLREAFEAGRLNWSEDFPGMIVSHAIVVTNDQRLIIAQRKRTEVDFAGGAFSPSFEEGWNPEDILPSDAVRRGLSEEFHADKDHNIHVSADNIRLLAVAREWGAFWNVALLYIVNIPTSAENFLRNWNTMPYPKDRNEHSGICAAPLGTKGARAYLEDLVRQPKGAKVSGDRLRALCGEQFVVGSIADGPLHQTSGRARIILALQVLAST
jgi:hypothetical protein